MSSDHLTNESDIEYKQFWSEKKKTSCKPLFQLEIWNWRLECPFQILRNQYFMSRLHRPHIERSFYIFLIETPCFLNFIKVK